ncbi:hypothetical protein [Aureivirga sp. CE67]|uniref:hypothetical protein n=1 Tax=Aureivirga sp. CE67 TaxID=1788983 RepID=UPI001E3A6D10|nr:hypothetical protein [Aureivirga sp. CE67]
MQAQKTIHVFVALCDNEFQGIVPVPEKIGNGKDPRLNLYWGAGYGMKSFFKLKTKDWKLISKPKSDNPYILDRILFKHATKDVYILADAYDGEQIKMCTENFLKASNQQNQEVIEFENKKLRFGGDADLISYIGHDGLMDFSVEVDYLKTKNKKRDVIILACYSREFFSPEIKKANANPILWTTHLMAPEAYTLKAAIDGWMNNETGKQIDERAAQAYHKYQKCGIRGARNLFTTGFKN